MINSLPNARWKCPICRQVTLPNTLWVDPFFVGVLRACGTTAAGMQCSDPLSVSLPPLSATSDGSSAPLPLAASPPVTSVRWPGLIEQSVAASCCLADLPTGVIVPPQAGLNVGSPLTPLVSSTMLPLLSSRRFLPRTSDLSAPAPLSGASVDLTGPVVVASAATPGCAALFGAITEHKGPAAVVQFFGPLLLPAAGLSAPRDLVRGAMRVRPDLGFELDAVAEDDGDESDDAGAAGAKVGPAALSRQQPANLVSSDEDDGPPTLGKRAREPAVIDLTDD